MKWFSIFKTGKHTDSAGNEKEWTEADIDKIVETYQPEKHEAPIVIGHPKTNAPAFGWIEKLKRVGDTLYALPKQLTNEFVEMVNKGLFKKRSISLYPDGTLRHVGFLGAQPPAVKGLPDVEFKEEEEARVIETEGNTDMEDASTGSAIASPEDGSQTGPATKDIKELEAEVESYKAQLNALNEKEKEYEEMQTKYAQLVVEKAELEKEIQRQKRERELREFGEVIDKAIAEGKLLPRMKDTMTKLFEIVSLAPYYEFSDGGRTEPGQLMAELIDAMPRIIEFGETGKPMNKKENDLPASKIVAEEIRKQMNN